MNLSFGVGMLIITVTAYLERRYSKWYYNQFTWLPHLWSCFSAQYIDLKSLNYTSRWLLNNCYQQDIAEHFISLFHENQWFSLYEIEASGHYISYYTTNPTSFGTVLKTDINQLNSFLWFFPVSLHNRCKNHFQINCILYQLTHSLRFCKISYLWTRSTTRFKTGIENHRKKS